MLGLRLMAKKGLDAYTKCNQHLLACQGILLKRGLGGAREENRKSGRRWGKLRMKNEEN